MRLVVYRCDSCDADLSVSVLDHITLTTPRQNDRNGIGVGPRPEMHYCSMGCLRAHLAAFVGLD